jgi:hypothetical protein
MHEGEKRTLEVHGKTYELHPHSNGVVVEVLGTTYEIYENNKGGFEVNRVESDGYTAGIGNDLSSECAAIELAEIFERLHRFVRDKGYMSQLSELEWYLEQWKETPPIRNE